MSLNYTNKNGLSRVLGKIKGLLTNKVDTNSDQYIKSVSIVKGAGGERYLYYQKR